MTQYVFQVQNDNKQLVKSYEVSVDSPIRDIAEVHNLNRQQIVITDTTLYNQVLDIYDNNLLKAEFTLNEATNEISWQII